MSDNLETVIAELRQLHREDKFAIKTQIRMDNSLLAFIRVNVLGWTPDLPAKDSERIKKRAAEIVKTVLKGENMDDEAASVATIVMLSNEAKGPFDKIRADNEKRMKKLAGQLPACDWAKSVNGFGDLSFARIIGECGDLADYDVPCKVWKRMGYAPITKGGKTMSGHNWATKGGLTAQEWSEAGYSPSRRSLMYVVEESLYKVEGYYREVYLARLATEHAKAIAEGLVPATTGQTTVESWERRGLPPLALVKKIEPDKHRSGGHMSDRARRYMGKRLLKHLWQAWNGFEPDMSLRGHFPRDLQGGHAPHMVAA